MEIKNRFSISAKRMSRSVIRELLKLANKPDIISFAGGLPSPETFPSEELLDITQEVMKNSARVALQYGSTEGVVPLRDLLISFLGKYGFNIKPEELIITTASQQSLDLVAKIFIDRSDPIIVENPSYLGALSAFKTYGCRFLTVDMDEQGLCTDKLRLQLEELKRTAGEGSQYYQNMPKFIYTIPDFQNPTGITMSLERRKELLEIASEYDMIIVEDVPYRWLRYQGEEPPMIGAMDTEGRVVNLFTFSKILSPGMRLGWVRANPVIIDKIVQAKQATDLCTSPLTQKLAEEFIRRNLLEKRIDANIELYRHKQAAMMTALEKYMPKAEGLSWVKPEGGMFLWITLPPEMDADEMFKEAIDRKVAYVVGSAFYPNGGGHNTMRLNFSYPSEEEIDEGIQRLAGVVKSRL
jgi:2-aminoadipate transaminase